MAEMPGALRDAGIIPDLAVTTSSAFSLFTQAAVGDGILPASPPPFNFALSEREDAECCLKIAERWRQARDNRENYRCGTAGNISLSDRISAR